jgi:hypothetical protein
MTKTTVQSCAAWVWGAAGRRSRLRMAIIAAALWWLVAIAQTTPYLGLPLEPRPAFLDCYEQAKWDGHTWRYSGRTLCLGEQR